MICKSLTAVLISLMLCSAASAQTSKIWLDQPLTNWNRPEGNLPSLPSPLARERPTDNRCAAQIRPPASPAETALVRRGWRLYGATQSYGLTTVVTALSGFDGMCRPLGFQAFVYWEGRYAGTLSPTLMNSRTDGAMVALRLVSETNFVLDFARYAATDPLCCPSKLASVSYALVRDDVPSLTATRVDTVVMCQGNTSEGSQASDSRPSSFALIASKRWTLAEIAGQRLRENQPTLEFDAQARRVSGDSGCNRFSGSFEVNGSTLKLSQLVSTRRACLSAKASQLEANFLGLLEATTRFELAGGQLRLYSDKGLTLVFSQQ